MIEDKNIINKIEQWLNYEYTWVLYVFLIVLLTLSVAFFARVFLNKLAEKAQKTKNPWDDAIIIALHLPCRLLIWLMGISLSADLVAYYAKASISLLTGQVRAVGVIVILAWFLVKLLKAFEANLIHKTDDSPEIIDATTATAIGKLLRAAIIITTVLIVMQSLGYSISGVLAFGGIGGLAVGFAAKDLLANFFGGLTIYLDRPFKVGDWVRSPDKEIEGTVEDVGWRLTRIRTFDKRPLYVPNATFTQISLENPSRMRNRRIKETIGIRYEDASKMLSIVNDTREMLLNHDDIDTTQTLMVNFNEFAPSSLDFFIYTFTKTTNWEEFHQIKQDVMLAIINIIQAHGAECAFPTSTLHLANYPSTNKT
ncbi:MAG: MscS family membrane protein [Cellvibrionaceae bacterium]